MTAPTWIRDLIVDDDPNPRTSRLDRLDGVTDEED